MTQSGHWAGYFAALCEAHFSLNSMLGFGPRHEDKAYEASCASEPDREQETTSLKAAPKA
jgi:hypothetical protein